MREERTGSVMVLTYDEELHEYGRDGKPTPSVTQVLTAAGLINKTWYKPGAASRGTEVHNATESMDSLDLEPCYFPEEIQGYLIAWDRFKRESGIKVLESETRIDHVELDYAGRIDRIIENKAGDQMALDIKTGAKADWHRLQVAAYGLPREKVKGGMIVYLSKEGKYTTWVRSGADFRLDTFEWIETRKRVKEKENE